MALPIDTVPGSVLSGFGFALEEHGCLFEQLPVCGLWLVKSLALGWTRLPYFYVSDYFSC